VGNINPVKVGNINPVLTSGSFTSGDTISTGVITVDLQWNNKKELPSH
jgi:hypothetical protein